MKHINWKASARNGGLLVNLHESTLSQKVVLLLDCEGAGTAVTDTLNETSISIAAALAARMLQDGISVTIQSNGTDILTGKPLSTGELTGRSTALHMRRQLARLVCKIDLPVLAALESLAGGHEAVWILPEDPNLPAHRRMTETSKHVDIVRWSI